jgi:hypothetical protein
MISKPIFLNSYLRLNNFPILSISILFTDFAEILWKGSKYTFSFVMKIYP